MQRLKKLPFVCNFFNPWVLSERLSEKEAPVSFCLDVIKCLRRQILATLDNDTNGVTLDVLYLNLDFLFSWCEPITSLVLMNLKDL